MIEISSILVLAITIYFVSKPSKKISKTITSNKFYLKGAIKYFIYNLNRSVIGIGGAGSGKTYSLIKPLLVYCIKNRGCLTFDPKGELTPLINQHAKESNKEIINFSLDNNYDKINPLSLCQDKTDIIEFSSYFLSGIVGIPKSDTAKYFFNAAKSILIGVIIFFKNKNKNFATIPHIVALFLTVNSKELISLLSSDEEAKRASMILSTVKDDPKLLGSIISTFTAYFGSLDTPKIFRNLVSNEPLNLPNNPSNPCVINLIFNLQKRDLYTPIYSSIVGLIIKKMNIPHQHESAIIIDEFTVLSIPNFVNIPETARSNKIATCIAIQDLSQLISRYGKEDASSIISNMGSQFLFRTTNPETLDHFEKMLGRRDIKSISKNIPDFSLHSSVTHGVKEKNILKKEQIINYKPGQVFGIISEGNKTLIENERINGNHYLKKTNTKPLMETDTNSRIAYDQVYRDINSLIIRDTSIKTKKFNI
ncbi:Type IV secretory system Conjugative DNA transfer [Tenacibaculum sp. MAR_2009_124]|uniref:type IV secretory system conjugative DNA transfer family protein n=1 Tax=Tenacibaculum sp. MAR_2009_124 TaxID=1250059 RepID=UPI000894D809|nr:type IV secretory system conjugative DNA transfer family protein [Tenacibaculum sp. MAR_2009_124]SEB51463.1 Type IV secretory system Conjugative DNA transfer [Tenacibaculum sp. MAR_2009_124]